jgi:hypothetical protein
LYEIANELGRGITTEIDEHFTGSWQMCSTPSFRFFEKYSAGISVSQHRIPGTANGHVNHKNWKALNRVKLVKYTPETIQENLLTLSSAVQAVCATIALLKAVSLVSPF